ncbi:MAG: PrsW family intramembrane metalloprotease [Gammaproteobacteria bacterium]|jgi:RsiW-degrading membrane proteinase PrsW (M82 family)|nr:PrsW family intramembrane metalloprotease [Gammaproteobacteria bacterium]MBT5204526.1 PrsW family intramembrane metalloprotease [Gammaproteobacteria bacterium]MBT5602343.1 PrsW family intramembrane metalloprotease [Gammaproteobacteria bacterium]MBT6247256.1 PrsW family intramembrane metalloprotease [Gammaproteobacteria bacterium]
MILFLLALAPGLAIALYVYWRDKHEKEPLGLLLKCFFLGAATCIPAAIAESFFLDHFGFDLDTDTDLTSAFLAAFFIVGFFEELGKYLVLVLFAYRKPAFNEPFDGIIYAVMISLGFATLENIFYVAQGGMGTAIVRIFTAVPMHAAFGIFMGYYVGKAKFEKSSSESITRLKGLTIAICLHGAYDFLLFQNESVLLTLSVLPLIIASYVYCSKAMKVHANASPFKD